MRKVLISAAIVLVLSALSIPALATNGDNIIGVGAISRSIGGVGAAAPQDAITAVFGNPAAMCYIPCETSEVDFAGTVFDPSVRAKVTVQGNESKATSQGAPFAFPAIGIYTPISNDLKFGLAAYGVSGLGVDYKDTDLRGAFGFPDSGAGPADIFTQLQIMKFAPNIAYRVLPNLSVGAALQVNWAQLDLGDGSSHAFGIGTQVGVSYNPMPGLMLGLTYQTPQKHTFKRITNLDGQGGRDRLALEQPQQIVLGVAYEVIPKMVLVEVDGKWINWADATGYDDFDWKDQYIAAVGVQVRPVDWMAVRLGYNYGNNPVKEHNGWSPDPSTTRDVQGSQVPVAQYEFLRVVGFPAVVEHHITAGAEVDISKKVSLNAGYTHAFQKTIKEDSGFSVIQLESSLFEDSYEFGLNIKF